MIAISHYESPLGTVLLAAKEKSLIGLRITPQTADLSKYHEPIQEQPQNPVLLAAKSRLDRYFAGEKPSINELPLNPIGNEFSQTVRNLLKTIPYGKTTSYGAIAQQVASIRGIKKMSAQAIGGAVGRNPIAIIIPCHRVIGKSGALVGYTGGLDLKIALLQHESNNSFPWSPTNGHPQPPPANFPWLSKKLS